LELEHLCRQGLGAVCRQMGRFEDAIREHELALAMARRTLNPVLAAEDTSDVAVAEMALGNFERSNGLFEKAAAMLEQQPDPRGPTLLRANQAELFLGVNDLQRAKGLFEAALEPALWLKDLPITFQVLGGLALCAQRLGSHRELGHWSGELRRIGAGRERLYHERWQAEAALAWDTALNHGQVAAAAEQLRVAANELRHRDVDHWLLVELELVRLKVARDGVAPRADVERLTAAATSHSAGAILRALETLGA
jgi:tetratricopeptide (TPR) repeat protein